MLNESARVSGSIITTMLCSSSIITFGGLVFVLNYIKRRNQVIQLEKKVQEQYLVVKIQETERIKQDKELIISFISRIPCSSSITLVLLRISRI
mgnify:CR=1 FL=1